MSIYYVSDGIKDIDLDDGFWSIKDTRLHLTELYEEQTMEFERVYSLKFLSYEKVVIDTKTVSASANFKINGLQTKQIIIDEMS